MRNDPILAELAEVSGLAQNDCDHDKFVEFVELHRNELKDSRDGRIVIGERYVSILGWLVRAPGDHHKTLKYWIELQEGCPFVEPNHSYVRTALSSNNIECAKCLVMQKRSCHLGCNFDIRTFVRHSLCTHLQTQPAFCNEIIASMGHEKFCNAAILHECSIERLTCKIRYDPQSLWNDVMAPKVAQIFVYVCLITNFYLQINKK